MRLAVLSLEDTGKLIALNIISQRVILDKKSQTFYICTPDKLSIQTEKKGLYIWRHSSFSGLALTMMEPMYHILKIILHKMHISENEMFLMK